MDNLCVSSQALGRFRPIDPQGFGFATILPRQGEVAGSRLTEGEER